MSFAALRGACSHRFGATALAGAVAMAAAVAASRAVVGDVTLGLSWPEARAPYRVLPSFPDHDLTGDPARQIALLRCAADVWSRQTRVGFQLIYEGEATEVGTVRDGVHTLAWVDDDGNGALAVTLFYGRDGEMIDFDTRFYDRTNGVSVPWSGGDAPPAGSWDLRAIATHEFGHALGLGHIDYPDATMYFKVSSPGIDLRTLDVADHACLETLYDPVQADVPGPSLALVAPAAGPTSGGNAVTILGDNFTTTSETRVRVDGRELAPSRWILDDCGALRIVDMPSHDAGTVAVEVVNSLGAAAATYTYEGPPLAFARLDTNTDGAEDLSDALTVLGVLFLGMPAEFPCAKAGDVDDDGIVDIADAVSILHWLFLGGAPPSAPWPDCGSDPTPDSLGCDGFERCL